MLDQLTMHIVAQARAIADVPVAFIGSLLVVGAIVYLSMRWRYRRVTSELEIRLKLSEGRLAEFAEKLNTVSPDEAKARVDELEARLSVLTQQLSPRRLTDRQRVIMRDVIVRPVRVNCSIDIEHDMSCSDCKNYAQDFCAVFAAIPDWRVNALGFYDLEQIPASGLGLHVVDPDNLTTTEFLVLNALQQAGIPHDVVRGRTQQTDVGLLVTVPRR
jgi:hypothetical protein